MKALIIGATGATGSALIEQLLRNENFHRIEIFARKKINLNHEKLICNLVDFNELETWKNKLKGDVLFSALGTTRKDAGSKSSQYKVDFTYQLNVAKIAAENMVKQLVLVSSTGANSKSLFFYPKIKGKLEDEVKKMDFDNVHIFQPPILIRQKDKIRPNEVQGIKLINKINKIGLLRSQKPMPIDLLAEKMINASLRSTSKKIHTYSPKMIFHEL